MSATAFQRRRRELAKLQAEALKVQEERQNAKNGEDEGEDGEKENQNANEQTEQNNEKQSDGENGQENDEKTLNASDLTIDVVGTISVEKVKEFLDQLGVPYVHNTGEAKLRDKLREQLSNAAE